MSDTATSESKLLELECGTRLPNRTQLSKIAKTYRRPLLTFYLAAPPPKADRGSDFKTLGPPISSRDNALLDAVLRDVKARHRCLQAFLRDEDELTVKPFVGSCSLTDDVEKVATRIRSALEFSDRPDTGHLGRMGCSRISGPELKRLGCLYY